MKNQNASIRFTVAALMMLLSQASLASTAKSSSDFSEKARAAEASKSSCTAKVSNDAHNLSPAGRAQLVAKALGETSEKSTEVRSGQRGRTAR